jgi:hypothetical protein
MTVVVQVSLQRNSATWCTVLHNPTSGFTSPNEVEAVPAEPDTRSCIDSTRKVISDIEHYLFW